MQNITRLVAAMPFPLPLRLRDKAALAGGIMKTERRQPFFAGDICGWVNNIFLPIFAVMQ